MFQNVVQEGTKRSVGYQKVSNIENRGIAVFHF